MDLRSLNLEIIAFFLVACYVCSTNSYSQNLGPSNQPEAYFNGSSYIRLQTTISLKKQTGLSFRTCTGGVLFSQQLKDDLIELSVNAEGILFFAKTAGKTYNEKILGNFLNNKWHVVVLMYKLGNLTLQVNDERKLIANSSYRHELLTSPGLSNEGAVLLVGKQFNGCLLEGPTLVFNNTIITSSPNVRFEKCPIPEDSCVPKENIKEHDFCVTEPCMRHGTCNNGQNGYTCSCLPRYTGKNCEFDNGNPCEKSPPLCKNGATCISNISGEYTCRCPPEYTGKHCESKSILLQECQHSKCQNGATCIIGENGTPECMCLPGFGGVKCEFNIDECKPNPCKNGGICVDGLNNYTCDCRHTGYKGRHCEINIDECLSNPCSNYGTCFDTYGGYLCMCPPGYGDSNCQQPLSECMSHPCLHGGSCTETSDGFKCHCLSGFGGHRCEAEERQALCDNSKCHPYGDCVDSFGCVCKQEYPGNFPNCSVDTICRNNPCKNGATCLSSNGSFNCSCVSGFTGKYCQLKIEGCTTHPCLNGGMCVEHLNGLTCNCTEHWMGSRCEIPYDACERKPCRNNATCVLAPNRHDFKCECLSGFEGHLCETNIDDCADVKCHGGKVCVDLVNGYDCRCPLGYSGENCSVETDPCARQPCAHGATCQVDQRTHEFYCFCPGGYTGALCDIDIDECGASPAICNQGICQNEDGGFQCYCRPGYTGERCDLDFNECLSMPCQNNATCLNQVNNYECVCPPGYTGKDCSVDINECEPMPCMNGSTCVDGVNEYSCVCQPGLTGKVCDINIDDCESSPCLNGAQCIDGLNSYTCNCADTGFTGDHCQINIDDCVGDSCKNGAHCLDRIKDYYCDCYDGYTGKNCELDINECDSNPCKNDGTCLERSNKTLYNPSAIASMNMSFPDIFSRPFDFTQAAGYECLCVKGVTGVNCEIDINECESSPCFQGTCIDKLGGYTCDCNEGFDGEHCETDIDECEKYKPCVHGICYDKKANYYCDCETNYGGKNCSVALIGCVNNPCLNNGTCKPYLVNENTHRFNCSCPNGYHGPICEKVSTMSLSGKSMIMINTSREEGYDIQFRFKTTLGDGILALGNGPTYYILELSRGRLNLHSSLLNKWEGVFIGSNLNDSNWQRVFVAINSTHLVLSANDEQTIYPITFNENYNNTYTSFPLTYIGGTPSNYNQLTHGQPFLVGCIEDVLVNGEWVLPDVKNPSVTLKNVEKGCSREPQCHPNPCHSGGHCTDLWLDFKCTCERPYLGHTCQYNYTAATFGYENITDSLVTVSVDNAAKRAVRTIVDISMFIRTRQAKGQIFYLGSALGSTNHLDETYIAAQLEGGELLVRIQFNGTPEAYTVGGVKLDNGYNHLIEVIRNVTLVQVKLNGTEYFRKTISATGTLDAEILFLGGQPQTRLVRQANDNLLKIDAISPTTSAAIATPLSNIHFKGIIQDVQISNGSVTMVVEFFPLQANDLEIPMSFGKVKFEKDMVKEGIWSDDSCRFNPCRNGTCENTWNDYRCICTRGFKGKDCSDLEFCELNKCPNDSICKNLEDGYECIANATFSGKSPALQYRLNSSPNSTKSIPNDTLELTYRTRSWGTILFAKHDEDYFAIFVYHNAVVVEWNIKKSSYNERFTKDHFEGQWLTLYFDFKNNMFIGGFKDMVMDEIPNIKAMNFDTNGLANIFKFGVIYLGGSDNQTFDFQNAIENLDNNQTGYIPAGDTTTTISITSNSLELNDLVPDALLYKVDQNKKTDHFKGCLNEIRIGGMLLPYFPPKQVSPEVLNFELLDTDFTPKIGCILCYSSDCLNEGTCINPNETYKCNCVLGYTGDDCSIDINECENHHCENNATCIDLVGKYKCECPPGYEGINCENDIDECASNPCKHGGTCIDQIGNFKCECPEDFVGKQCEAPLLITCDNKPCRDGSTCKTGPNEKTGNNFTCFCMEGMEGPLCDTPFCLSKQCENEGICNTTTEVPFCSCQRGFKGKFCEINIDDCVLPTGGSPCQNGGICIDGNNRYDCNCTNTGYTGLLCEMDIDECQITLEKNRLPCGPRGTCVNILGSYKCTCDIRGKCGHSCALDDPCEPMNPCEHGICISQCITESDYECKCEDRYTGKNCTDLKVAASQSDSVNILYIVIPIVLILTIGIAIGMAILVNIARSKRATRGTYSPSAQEFCNPRVELDHVLKPPPEERLI